jgi:NAD(P)-dependent dehydrogenase (short-subunit alcohol dehydrogenase family)
MNALGMAGRLEGKVALITGTGRGQGRVAALTFAREGATVVGCDLLASAEETVQMVRAEGGSMTSSAPVDLGDPVQAREWVDAAAREHGGFDILYNNASSPRFASIAELSDEDWRFTMRNELDLVFYTCRAAWPHLIERGGASIINIASISGMNAIPIVPGQIAHAATKGAIIGMTRELAQEGGRYGIRANTISPGVIETPATAEILAQEGMHEAWFAANMIQRLGKPQDVVAVALFLASDESSWITGANITVDGGYTAH